MQLITSNTVYRKKKNEIILKNAENLFIGRQCVINAFEARIFPKKYIDNIDADFDDHYIFHNELYP